MPDSTQQGQIQPFVPPGLPSGLAGLIGQPDQPAQQSTPPLSQTSPVAPSAGAPPPAGGAPPQQNPLGPMAPYGALAQQQQTQLLNSAPAQALQTAQKNIATETGKYDTLQVPKFGPHIDKDASIVHNLGQALLMGLGATGMGRNIENQIYGPQIKQYEEEKGNIAARIKAYQDMSKTSAEEMQTLGSVTGRTIYGGAQVEKGEKAAEVGMAGVAQKAAQAGLRHQDVLARIQGAKDINAATIAAKEYVAKLEADTKTEIGRERNVTAEDVAAIHKQAMEDLGNLKMEPGIWDAIKENVFGVPTRQTPGGAAPTTRTVQPAPGPGKGEPANKAKISPQRPKGVPSDAVWNPKTRHWEK